MKTKEIKLSRLSRELFTDFDDSAQSWGYQSDQGNGKEVDSTFKCYEISKKNLEKRILYLEKQLKAAKNKLKTK